ncbi:MAG TPA: DUF6504 family protein [Anaerolineales bacterium]|nr:DUF6504 family protein [Anaerolineales bacterium]
MPPPSGAVTDSWRPVRFIGTEVQVTHLQPPALAKKPAAPDAFTWAGRTFRVSETISMWTRYERRGRMADNLAPAHLETAARRGSWGVGRFYFRVRTDSGDVYDLYYDREPEAAGDRAGHWYLWREVRPASPS